MFSNQITNQKVQTGKRILPNQGRKGQFKLNWDYGNDSLNQYQKKKVKQVTGKPNQVQPFKREQSSSSSKSPYINQNIQKPSQYQQEEVMSYLKKYQKIEQMPPEQLQKVMAYYDSLKEPKKVNQRKPQYQSPYQQVGQKRQLIKPRQSAGGVIYGSNAQQQYPKPGSRYSQKKHQTTIMIGDGYNYFKQQAQRKQQEQILRNGNSNQYGIRNDYKPISNIQFG